MKCPKCQTEVERGSLYCPKCLTEIPWVKEFDSVETLMEKKRQTEPHILKNRSLKRIKSIKKKLLSNKKTVFILSIIAAVLIGVLCYRQLHTFSALYTKANKFFMQQNYDLSMKYIEEALEENPENLSANLLFAKLLEKEGDTESAILVLRPMIKKYPDDAETAKMYVRLLSYGGHTGDIRSFLSNCSNQEILNACGDYICPSPVASLPPGTYTSVQTLELCADYDRIFYTLDGSMPNQNSTRYTGTIILKEGTTELNAFGINDKNISSDIISRKYVIVLKAPDAPEITPDSGIYRKDTKIKLTVPDGCRAYYAFDKKPTVNSTEYKTPISLPQGSHTFYAILVAANGKISEAASREYYLEY